MLTNPVPPPLPEPSTVAARHDDPLWKAAKSLEATFLAEMLKSTGWDAASEGLGGGGVGEEHFQSFLREAQAEAIVDAGGIGLAESLYEALKVRAHA